MGEDIEFLTLSQINQKRIQCTPNYFLIPAKVCYFLKQAKFAVMEYTMLFYVNIGLNPAEAGIINGIQNIGGVIGAPVWTLVADRLKLHKTLCFVLSVMSLFTFCIQPVLPLLFADKGINQCPGNMTDEYLSLSDDSAVFNHHKLYYGLLVTSVLASSFDGSVMSFIDSAVIQRVQLSPIQTDFGKQRTLGCIGTAAGSYLFAFGIKFFPVNTVTSCYTGVFVGYFLISIAFTVSCYFLFHGLVFTETQQSEIDISVKPDDVTRLLLDTLKHFETIFFFINVLILGVLQASYYTFTYMYLQQELNAPTLLFPISMTVCATTGCFVYYNGSRVLEYINGTEKAFCITLFFWVARYVGIAFLTNPFYILFTDTLNALTYSLSMICIIEHIKAISDPAILTTMSGLMNCLFNYLGYFISSVVGGLFIRLYGGQRFFVSLAALSAIWFFVVLLYIFVKRSLRKKSSSGWNYQPIG